MLLCFCFFFQLQIRRLVADPSEPLLSRRVWTAKVSCIEPVETAEQLREAAGDLFALWRDPEMEALDGGYYRVNEFEPVPGGTQQAVTFQGGLTQNVPLRWQTVGGDDRYSVPSFCTIGDIDLAAAFRAHQSSGQAAEDSKSAFELDSVVKSALSDASSESDDEPDDDEDYQADSTEERKAKKVAKRCGKRRLRAVDQGRTAVIRQKQPPMDESAAVAADSHGDDALTSLLVAAAAGGSACTSAKQHGVSDEAFSQLARPGHISIGSLLLDSDDWVSRVISIRGHEVSQPLLHHQRAPRCAPQ